MNAEMALKELLYYYSIQRLREKSAFLYFKKIMTVVAGMDYRRADASSISRAIEIGLCNVCLVLYLDPKNEGILLKDINAIDTKIRTLVPDILKNDGRGDLLEAVTENLAKTRPCVCPGCFNCLSGSAINSIAEKVLAFAETCTMHTNSIGLEFVVPPVLDAVRLTARTVATRIPLKIFPFPTISELLGRLLKIKLAPTLNIVEPGDASYVITLTARMENQVEYCLKMNSNFKIKKPKRKFVFGVAVQTNEEPSDDITRDNTDQLLISYKNLNSEGLDKLRSNLVEYVAGLSPSQPQVTWSCAFTICPIYLFGRYRKLARDVPQAPWTVSSSSGNNNNEGDDYDEPPNAVGSVDGATKETESTMEVEEDAEPESASSTNAATATGKPKLVITLQRKGRNSVEEIISHTTCQVLQASGCRLHPCGREDIDVRCLGNGRPFAFEVNGALQLPTRERLEEIVRSINARQGLNTEGDVELFKLSVSDRSLWEGMQEKAEEKRKGYCCVVWSADKIDQTKLRQLEQMCRSGAQRDEEGRPCIELSQKTPLRVMHRRSLLTRKRYIYNIETALLNDHFFILRLVTSAGTYVKEFVHGDLGRTVPNVASIINCQADILQLDVTWLYDDFEGGGEDVSGGNYVDSSVYSGVATAPTAVSASGATEDINRDGSSVAGDRKGVRKDGSSITWKSMQSLNLAAYNGK